jgi:hypothetical protein
LRVSPVDNERTRRYQSFDNPNRTSKSWLVFKPPSTVATRVVPCVRKKSKVCLNEMLLISVGLEHSDETSSLPSRSGVSGSPISIEHKVRLPVALRPRTARCDCASSASDTLARRVGALPDEDEVVLAVLFTADATLAPVRRRSNLLIFRILSDLTWISKLVGFRLHSSACLEITIVAGTFWPLTVDVWIAVWIYRSDRSSLDRLLLALLLWAGSLGSWDVAMWLAGSWKSRLPVACWLGWAAGCPSCWGGLLTFD